MKSMKKKNVYMWQPGFLYGNNAYLPYSIGMIAAFSWSNAIICEEYNLAGMYYLRSDIKNTVSSIEDPYLCAFSCYVWNYEYNLVLARTIKEKFPNCLIVFGGHSISEQKIRQAIRENEYYIDFVNYFIYGEGEEAFQNLLLKLLDGSEDYSTIPNISYKRGKEHFFNKRETIKGLNFPSPYLTGIFDEIVEGDPYCFSMTFETNRGCPFSCAYCDWGDFANRGIRKFPMDRIKAELEWAAKHRIEFIMGADANYGIFERDEEIIDYMVRLKKETGYPQKFRVCFTKNTGERVFRINQKLNDADMARGATLSFQSLNKETLKIIGRQNISTDVFTDLMIQYNKANIPTYSEIILGLPGETKESFMNGIAQLLESGQHEGLRIYPCELLPNSAMGNDEFIKRYKIKTVHMKSVEYHHEPDNGEVQEYSDIIVQNSTCSLQDWKECYLFSWMISCFHRFALTRFISQFLFIEKGIRYNEFYENLMRFFSENKESVGGRVLALFTQILNNAIQPEGGNLVYYNPRFGNINWSLEEGGFLETVLDLDRFYEEMTEALVTYEMDKEMISDLIRYQEFLIKRYDKTISNIELHYDFHTYFMNNISGNKKRINKKSNILCITDAEEYGSLFNYAQQLLWYGAKGGNTIHHISMRYL